tara:strand:- start:181 stop:654 length:474 start_codon:yes stop_codon:yes gene_type:complete
MAFPKVGLIAPGFTLLNQDGKSVALTDFREKVNVVLYFYPKAMTPGCTIQACGIRDSKRKLSIRETVVLGISTDPVKRLMKFLEKEKLNFDLLSDEGHKVADQYGVWGLKKFMGREYMGLKRMTFIIGKDGKLKHIMEKVKTKTHHDDLLSLLDNIA